MVLVFPALILCQKVIASLGSYPAMAAKMSPIRSASLSLSRENLRRRLLEPKPNACDAIADVVALADVCDKIALSACAPYCARICLESCSALCLATAWAISCPKTMARPASVLV